MTYELAFPPAAKLHSQKDRYKIKLRDAGYRLVYEVQDDVVTVLVVAVVSKRGCASGRSALARLTSQQAVVTVTTMNSKEVIKLLEADGWFLARVRGSHHQFKHTSKPGLVTVKHPDGDIPAGTLNSIRKQAGWKK